MFLFLLIVLVGLKAAPALALNEAPIKFVPQVTIPGSKFIASTTMNLESNTGPIANYISAIYNYGVGIVGILSALMLMIGGLVWLTSAGSSSKVEQAKEIIGSSLAGMFLVLTAVLLLQVINPELVSFKKIAVETVKEKILEADTPFYASKDSIPKDTQLGTVCDDSLYGCNFAEPPTITVEDSACEEKFGKEEWHNRKIACISASPLKQLFCCGLSLTDQNSKNEWCKGKVDGTACQVSITGNFGSGYCSGGRCEGCKRPAGRDSSGAGQRCSYNYECMDGSGYCGVKDGITISTGECLSIIGSGGGKGYCAGSVKEASGCDNDVGDICTFDDCCPGLCCNHSGYVNVCVPGDQKDQAGGDDECKY
ncbi:MAG: pilin [Candidatus Falkowbacteria bacterium]